MEFNIDKFTVYKSGQNDIAFIVPYTGSIAKQSPIFEYQRDKNYGVLKKSNEIMLIFNKINTYAANALIREQRIHIVETENDEVRDRYWVSIKL